MKKVPEKGQKEDPFPKPVKENPGPTPKKGKSQKGKK